MAGTLIDQNQKDIRTTPTATYPRSTLHALQPARLSAVASFLPWLRICMTTTPLSKERGKSPPKKPHQAARRRSRSSSRVVLCSAIVLVRPSRSLMFHSLSSMDYSFYSFYFILFFVASSTILVHPTGQMVSCYSFRRVSRRPSVISILLDSFVSFFLLFVL